MSDFELIATLNSHLLDADALEAFVEHGVTILRVNGAHIEPRALARYVRETRGVVGDRVKILVDLPGHKIRTAGFAQPLRVEAGHTLELFPDQVSYPGFLARLQPGDVLSTNDSLLKFEVIAASPEKAVLRARSDGWLLGNKGIHASGRCSDLPFLFEKDEALIREARRHGCDLVGLSFVRTAEDVRVAKRLIGGERPEVVVKIETQSALENLDTILPEADTFLVDRGDLSADVGMEKVNFYQKYVLQKVKAAGKRVIFATQVLHSMTERNVPLIAEACGLSEAIEIGVDGIQLSEETAQGRFPLEVLRTVREIREFLSQRPHQLSLPRHSVLWLTGRSASGKSTLARGLDAEVRAAGYTCGRIDGDAFREFWGEDTGFSREERIKNQRNLIFTAYQAAHVFDVVIVASLSPYRELRTLARQRIPNFHEIFVRCSLETCRRRDPRGHYARAARGEYEHFIGVTDEYEEPEASECVVDTDALDEAEALQKLRRYVLG